MKVEKLNLDCSQNKRKNEQERVGESTKGF